MNAAMQSSEGPQARRAARAPFVHRLVVLLGAGLAAAGIAAFFFTFQATLQLESARASPEDGHAFVVALPKGVGGPADESAHPKRSRLQLFENGTALGPANAIHNGIRRSGRGRYSHWGAADGGARLYFSSSDNSDPRKNGRIYAIAFDDRLPRWMAASMLAAGAMLLFLGGLSSLAKRGLVRRETPGAVGLMIAGVLLMGLSATFGVVRYPPTTGPGAPPGYSVNIQEHLTGWDDPAIKRRAGESDHQFVERMTRTVFEKVYHCDYRNTPRLVDWMMVQLVRSSRDVGILTPAALKCGFCNQVSYVLARILNEGGIEAELLALNGHVVTLSKYGGKRWIADADYGVGPHQYPMSFAEVEQEYRRITGTTESWHAQVAAAYATTGDDTPYAHSMKWLNDLERRQRWLILLLQALGWAIGVVGLGLVAHGARQVLGPTISRWFRR